MRPHISLNVQDVGASVDFYRRVFGIEPQKQTTGYAKFDLPVLNFSLLSGRSSEKSRVNHLGLEVGTTQEVKDWEARLAQAGIAVAPEEGTSCCYAKQDKVWFEDPDGNAWEIFVVHAQLPVTSDMVGAANKTGDVVSKTCC